MPGTHANDRFRRQSIFTLTPVNSVWHSGRGKTVNWPEVMSSRGDSANFGDLGAEVMAIYQTIGTKTRKRIEARRAGGFECGEPMQ